MNRERGTKGEEGKGESVGMAKDFDFQMPVIYVLPQAQQQRLILHKFHSWEAGVTQFLEKLANSPNTPWKIAWKNFPLARNFLSL